jgi:endoglucanase
MMLDLLKELLSVYAPSSREDALSQRIAELARPCAEVKTDSLGNVLAVGGNPKLMLCAPMDAPGFAVTHDAGGGFFRFACMNADRTAALCRPGLAMTVGRALGVMAADGNFNPASPHPDAMFLDFGANAGVKVGDIAALAPDLLAVGEGLRAATMARAGCALLLDLLSAGSKASFLFTARQNLSSRGARNIAPALDARLIVSVELSACGSSPGSKNAVTLGGGPVLRLTDNRFPYRAEALDALRNAAGKAGVALQVEAVASGQPGEASILSAYGGGTPAAVLGLPARYLDTHAPLIHPADLEAAKKVLAALALEV